MGGCIAFEELPELKKLRVKMLESDISAKAKGVFLWVVLVAGQIVKTAQDNNDLDEIQKILKLLPPGLENLRRNVGHWMSVLSVPLTLLSLQKSSEECSL